MTMFVRMTMIYVGWLLLHDNDLHRVVSVLLQFIPIQTGTSCQRTFFKGHHLLWTVTPFSEHLASVCNHVI